jgi:hypothetical protein
LIEAAMQLTKIFSLLAMAVAIQAAPAPNPEPEVADPYLKVRDPGCIKRDPSCGYTYIKRSEVPELIARDNNNFEEAYLKGWSIILSLMMCRKSNSDQ